MNRKRNEHRGFVLGLMIGAAGLWPAATAHAQGPSMGRLSGRVVNATSGEPIAKARVAIAGTPVEVQTDLDGRYLFTTITSKSVNVVVRHIGFAQKTVTDVDVASGSVTVLNITLEPAVFQLEGITVTADVEKGSAVAVLDQRRTSQNVLEAVSADEIRALPSSDAADVAKRMTGVTVSEGKYVYVRGLGDRYSQTQLNGSPLPSPEPEKEVVPLDLFPSSFLETVAAQKTYSPDRPADFSGGAVRIQTRDFPNRFQWSFEAKASMNTQSQFKDNFLSYTHGSRDFLGIDDGSRALPYPVDSALGGLRSEGRIPSNSAARLTLGQSFQREFNPQLGTTPISRSFNGSVGSLFSLFGLQTGFLAGLTYADDYTVVQDEVERKWRANLFDPTIPDAQRVANIDYTFQRGLRNVRLGTVGNLAFLLSPTQKVGVRTTFTRSTDDEARTYSGLNNEDLGGLVESDRLRFVRRDLYWGQVFGDHQLFWNSRLEWRGTMARALRNEPALRETIYLNRILADSSAPYYLENVGESGRYLWGDMTDDDLNFELDWNFPFRGFAAMDGSVQVGGAYRTRKRDFAARRFLWQFPGGVVRDIEQNLTDDNITGTPPGPGEFRIQDIIEPGDQYIGEDTRVAGYAMVELPLSSRLRTMVGGRVENYDMLIESRGDTLSVATDGTVGVQKRTDFLPAVSLTYQLNRDMNLRLAGSRTLDRPEFRELAPFQFSEASSLRQLFGNPALIVATIWSGDARWDWFPRSGELVSASLFYKRLNNPIEQTFIVAASAAYSFQNAADADIYGAEFDLRKRLDFITPALNSVSFQGNLALIKSDVRVLTTGTFQPTNERRPLEGQSTYSLNLGLTYQSNYGGSEVGLFYDRQGERVTAAGGFGIPDILEQPRNQLDLNVSQALGRGFRLKLSMTNMLNEPYTFLQQANGVTLVQRTYKTGMNLVVGLAVGN
jgi:TonB dependent receptor-like, beta-barrel/Carboxypeptidase regulatory-like domain/TonB-dependent Receptor Plug Domain